MTCFYCKGHTEPQHSNFMAERRGNIIVIKNVPSQVCCQCGEISYSLPVAQRLEEMVKHAAQSAMEVSIASYAELAA